MCDCPLMLLPDPLLVLAPLRFWCVLMIVQTAASKLVDVLPGRAGMGGTDSPGLEMASGYFLHPLAHPGAPVSADPRIPPVAVGSGKNQGC